MLVMKAGLMLIVLVNFIRLAHSVVPPAEVEAFQQVMKLMGATNWRLNGSTCQLEAISQVSKPHPEADATVRCDIDCNDNSTDCHVISIIHKYYSLGGILPSELVKLPYLQFIDFAYNYLGGTIPSELGSTKLQSISLLGNRFSGDIPGELGNITTLIYLNLEANNLSGTIPSDLGSLVNLQTLILSSNQLMGMLPVSLAELRNLTDFRISGNNFSGPIPNFIQNWRLLNKIEIIGAGLQGPIPSSISLLRNLTDVRICELSGPTQGFPLLDNANGLLTLVLRNCNLSGEIPAYIWQKRDLQLLDVSFNKLVGGISRDIIGRSLRYVFLTGNMLSGDIPDTLLIEGATIDLSYNNFTWQGPDRPTCRPNMNLLLNLFRSSLSGNPLQDILPCTTDAKCARFSERCSVGGKKKTLAYAGFAVMGLGLVVIISAAVWWKWSSKDNTRKYEDFQGVDLKTMSFSLKQLKNATRNFSATSKIGEGGFGPVYKGTLHDGTIIAVKQLSSRSRQGNREFLNEIGVISCLQHPNLVKLLGYCIEGDQLLLVYEYMENNSLASALFDSNKSRTLLDWATRFKICVGIARGLAFLHEESRLKIVHRDIKATNVLLDKDLNPKISDFGLARLDEDEKTHVSTRVAGTIGYMAPEYALWGHLSYKADVYSFGVLALEIVSGKNNNRYIPCNDSVCLLDWACRLQTSKQYEELFDEGLESNINKEEAETVVKVALCCTNGSSQMRPTMSEVVSMLEGRTCVPELAPELGHYFEDLRFQAMRSSNQTGETESSARTYSATVKTDTRFSTKSSNDQLDVQSVDTRSF